MLLTGTPALAKPKELFNIFNILRPDIFTSLEEFGQRYCYKRKNPWSRRM
jgi:SWI/SNF-related matrix-associated actin-dependent regulator 1 of chromatin subfamily A